MTPRTIRVVFVILEIAAWLAWIAFETDQSPWFKCWLGLAVLLALWCALAFKQNRRLALAGIFSILLMVVLKPLVTIH
jgi:hypothetical protein